MGTSFKTGSAVASFKQASGCDKRNDRAQSEPLKRSPPAIKLLIPSYLGSNCPAGVHPLGSLTCFLRVSALHSNIGETPHRPLYRNVDFFGHPLSSKILGHACDELGRPIYGATLAPGCRKTGAEAMGANNLDPFGSKRA